LSYTIMSLCVDHLLQWIQVVLMLSPTQPPHPLRPPPTITAAVAPHSQFEMEPWIRITFNSDWIQIVGKQRLQQRLFDCLWAVKKRFMVYDLKKGGLGPLDPLRV
jgi:hypothetical protein